MDSKRSVDITRKTLYLPFNLNHTVSVRYSGDIA